MIRKFLIELLKGIEERVPPPPYCHHALTYAQYGSDQEGWEDRLALQINQNGVFRCVFLDEGDFDKNSYNLVADIVEMLKSPPVGNEQIGIALGQYVKP